MYLAKLLDASTKSSLSCKENEFLSIEIIRYNALSINHEKNITCKTSKSVSTLSQDKSSNFGVKRAIFVR